MGKQVGIEIKEDLSELMRLKRQQKTLPKQKRVIALIHLLKGTYRFRLDLANHLGVDRRTLRKWIYQYESGGIEALLEVRPRGNKDSKLITPQIHKALEARLTDPRGSFKGYWDVHRWIQAEFDIDISYNWVRLYLIKHFGTKVKRPRKSHVSKDEGAVALFKNPTSAAQTHC